MPVSRLESGAGFAFQELADDQMLAGLDQDAFVNKLAHHFDQVLPAPVPRGQRPHAAHLLDTGFCEGRLRPGLARSHWARSQPG